MNMRAKATFQAGSFAAVEALLVPKLLVGARNAAQAVYEDSQAIVPVDTGELKDSGSVDVEWVGHQVTGYVTYSAPWAAYNEFGTGRRGAASGHGGPGIGYDPNWPGMTGSPYMRPALDSSRPRQLAAFQEALAV